MNKEIIITTSEKVYGNELGLVTGSCVTSKIFYKDIFAGIRNFFGMEIKEYTQMVDNAKEKAVERMKNNAVEMGANAVTNVRFATSQTDRGAAEILAYGTAIKKV